MLILRIYFSVSPSVMAVVRFYSSEVVNGRALQRAAKLYPQLSIASELCYNVELTGECETACQMKMQEVVDSEEIVTTERHINSPCEDFPTHLLFFFSVTHCHCFFPLSAAGCESLGAEQKEVLLWLFRPPLQAEPLSEKPNLTEGSEEKLVEIGPR